MVYIMKKLMKFLGIVAIVIGFPIYMVAWYLFRIGIVQDNSKAFFEKKSFKKVMEQIFAKMNNSSKKEETTEEEQNKKEAHDFETEVKAGLSWLEKQDKELVNITSYDGLKLAAYFIPAQDEASDKVMLLMHGFRNVSLSDFATLYEFYHEQGFHILVPFERSHGLSEGKYICYGIKERFDVQKWTFYLTERFHGKCQIIMQGVSMGGATVTMAAGLDLPEQVVGIIDDCGFTTPWAIFSHVITQNFHLPEFPFLYVSEKICEQRAGFGFREYSTITAMKRNQLPMLFIHGAEDDFVPTRMGKENYEACIAKKELLIVEGAGHACSSMVAPELYRKAIMKFAEECLR